MPRKVITEVWTVQVNASILGPIAVTARKAHGKRIRADQFPPDLAEYLNIDVTKTPVRGRMLDFATVDDLVAAVTREGRDQVKVSRRGVTLTLHVDTTKYFKPTIAKGDKPRFYIKNLRDLCEHFCADEPRLLNKRVYKGTDCGASISVYPVEGKPLHNGDSRWENLKMNTPIESFTIQTIVEGSDATVDSRPFEIPCRKSSVSDWIQEMEKAASILWSEANEAQEAYSKPPIAPLKINGCSVIESFRTPVRGPERPGWVCLFKDDAVPSFSAHLYIVAWVGEHDTYWSGSLATDSLADAMREFKRRVKAEKARIA